MIGYYNYTVWLTYMSLMSGTTGIYFAFKGHPLWAIICLLVSGFLDLFDGKVARTKKNRSDQEKNFGIQIDSLTDLVCFGVLPATIGYAVGLDKIYFLPVLVLYVLCGMIRLAYFNVLEIKRQQEFENVPNTCFLGVPITAASMMFPLIYCLKDLLDEKFYIIYLIGLIVMGIAFVIRVRVKKFATKGTVCLVLLGIIVLTVALLFCR